MLSFKRIACILSAAAVISALALVGCENPEKVSTDKSLNDAVSIADKADESTDTGNDSEESENAVSHITDFSGDEILKMIEETPDIIQ